MRWIALIGLACVRCGGFGDDAPCAVSAGELVLTELGVRGESYVEIYNTGTARVDLEALSLSVAGSGAARSSSLSGTLVAHQYLSQAVRALADDGGNLTLSCGDVVIDSVTYAAAKSDVVALDGTAPPDAIANDALDLWCAQAGTPGGPNDPCSLDGDCEGRPPDVDELVITEVMANPSGSDTGHEWLQVYVAADEAISLAGLSVVHRQADGRSRHWTLPCIVGDPSEYVVVQPDGLALYNASETTLSIEYGDTVIDAAALPSLADDGTVAVLGVEPTADANDDVSAFCVIDADAVDAGCVRVGVGDLLISEVLRDPAGADTGHEWIELYVLADIVADGLAVSEVGSSTRRWTVVASEAFQAGSFVVLPVSGSAVPRLDGASALFNDTATLSIAVGDVVIDSVVVDCGTNGTSCGRGVEGLDTALCELNPPTPGAENTCD